MWQDISTAPKNGTEILVVKMGFIPAVAWWDVHQEGWHHCQECQYSDESRTSWDLTHWMPLPSPPEAQPQQKD